MRTKRSLEILNQYLSGGDGKGFDYLLDEHDFDVNWMYFSRLSKKRKREIILGIKEDFKRALMTDMVNFGLVKEYHEDFALSEDLLIQLKEIGESANALLNLIYRYRKLLGEASGFASEKES